MSDAASSKSPLKQDEQSGLAYFARVVMSDVYALLDFLSGRAEPSLASLPHNHTRSRRYVGDPHGSAGRSDTEGSERDAIKQDLADESALFCRAMKIGKQLDAPGGEIGPEDAAFLILVRDHLNVRAAPATGSSISFTIRVVERLLQDKKVSNHGAPGGGYVIPNKYLDNAAWSPARFVKHRLWYLWGVLGLTVFLSTYIACGKLLLEARDAVNRDFGANLASIVAEADQESHAAIPAGPSGAANSLEYAQDVDSMVDKFCRTSRSNIHEDQSCHQRDELKARKTSIDQLLGLWMFRLTKSDEKVGQSAATLVGVLGNYLLPFLYGWLGALGFVLRRLNRQLADCLLTPRDLRANYIRIGLGMVTGACIGLFVNSSTGAATLSGLGGAAVTLSASGVAFLAGYGVEAIFKMLDALMNHVFQINAERKDPAHG